MFFIFSFRTTDFEKLARNAGELFNEEPSLFYTPAALKKKASGKLLSCLKKLRAKETAIDLGDRSSFLVKKRKRSDDCGMFCT